MATQGHSILHHIIEHHQVVAAHIHAVIQHLLHHAPQATASR
jgi:hypothetical protein